MSIEISVGVKYLGHTEAENLRYNDLVFFWSAVALNVFTAVIFIATGIYRRFYLNQFSRGQLYFRQLPGLARFKLALWVILVLLDLVSCIYVYLIALVPVFAQEPESFGVGQHSNPHYSTRPALIFVLVVEAVNLAAYIFAAYLLLFEYVRKMQEAWYAHKFFVWTNFILGTIHLAIFWNMYSWLLIGLVLARLAIFFALMVAQRCSAPMEQAHLSSNTSSSILMPFLASQINVEAE